MKHKLELYFWILITLLITNVATYYYATLKELRVSIQEEQWIEEAVDGAAFGTSLKYRGKELLIREDKN